VSVNHKSLLDAVRVAVLPRTLAVDNGVVRVKGRCILMSSEGSSVSVHLTVAHVALALFSSAALP